MEILNWNKLIAIALLLIFYGCGQQTMKDEGLETKSINEAASSTPTFSVESLVVSANPPSKTSDFSFTITFEESITDYLPDKVTNSSGGVTACSNQSIQFYEDIQPNSCAIWNDNDPVYTNNNKTIQLTVKANSFSSSGDFTFKIPSNTISSSDLSKKVQEYTYSVTLAP